jgi:putative oxidoreductase
MSEFAASYGFLIARLLLAVVFLYSGVDKLCHWRESVAEVAALRLPFPALFAGLTIMTQLFGGVLMVTGWYAWAGAVMLAGFTLLATLLGHRFWLLHGSEMRHELTTALEHLAIIGGLSLVALSAIPPG